MFAFELFAGHEFERNIIGAVVAATVVFFASAYWFKPGAPENAHIEALDVDLRTPVPEVPEDLTRFGSLQEYRLIGKISLLLGVVLIGAFWVPSTPTAPSSINVLAGVMLLAIGAVLVVQKVDKRKKVEGKKAGSRK
jgi:Na+/H+ antiporter NhaD/arsenite permease-like protein